MRIAHISDPHLGYRAYNRVNREGVNVREADVFQAFRRALAQVRRIEPDLVVIAGDLFHVVRPSNLTIQHAFRELAQLTTTLRAPLVILGGNHDSPRSADTGCILDLYANLPGVRVAHNDYVQVKLPELNTSVFCLCHRALPRLSSLKIEPDASSAHNVLLAHGTVEGVLRNPYDLIEISRSQVISDSWDYIAFGHYHMFEELAPNAFYAGSLEYTSTNIWSETGQSKGFVEYDLEARRIVQFHEIATREVVDLRPIDAAGLTAADLNRMIAQRVESVPGGWANKIIRLVVENVVRPVQADLDYAAVRAIRADALHFDLQLRPPARDRRIRSDADYGPSRPLEDEWDGFAAARELPPGVDRDRLKTLGREYLARQLQME